jgi:hypothetical protein
MLSLPQFEDSQAVRAPGGLQTVVLSSRGDVKKLLGQDGRFEKAGGD